MNDHAFTAMGCELRFVDADDPDALEAIVHEFARRLTRFDPDSELSRLNRDPRERVPVSTPLHLAVAAALFAAELTGGLVDPTLCSEIEAAGYATTLPIGTLDLRHAPDRRPARPRDTWREVQVGAGFVTRPRGVRLDLGGTAKGMLADQLSKRAAAVDCGGDIRTREALPVDVIHPLTHEPVARVEHAGGVATSGIDRRCWEGGHHLLDPSTGRPAYTGLVGATALAPTAVEAEARAKAAVLSGPEGGRDWLTEHGGFLFLESGEVREA